jgi:hypothetical protein
LFDIGRVHPLNHAIKVLWFLFTERIIALWSKAENIVVDLGVD